MYLSKLRIENFRLFNKPITISFHKGLNLLVGENGCGKSTVIDAIRMLLNESEFSHKGLNVEDFNSFSRVDGKNCRLFVCVLFSELSDEQKIEYLTWLTPKLNARLNVEYLFTYNARNAFKQKRWGGGSSGSAFDWEVLRQHRINHNSGRNDKEKVSTIQRRHINISNYQSQGALNQTVRFFLSARYRFATANII